MFKKYFVFGLFWDFSGTKKEEAQSQVPIVSLNLNTLFHLLIHTVWKPDSSSTNGVSLGKHQVHLGTWFLKATLFTKAQDHLGLQVAWLWTLHLTEKAPG